MSIFKSILAKIFPSEHPVNTAPTQGVTPADSPAPAAAQSVDVNAVLSGLQTKSGEKLNWQSSIVDLLKLLGLDSNLTARKQLATELGYTRDTEDSAAMNMWLHKEVVRKLAENGGKLPDSMKQ